MSQNDIIGTVSEDMNYVKFVIPQSPVSSHDYESVELSEKSTEVELQSHPTPHQSGTSTDVVEEILACGGDRGEPHEETKDVTRGQEQIERLYYTLPRKTGLLGRLRRKPPRTVAEVGVQVDDCDGTPQQQLQKFMTGVSAQILQLRELCAKQERLESLGHKISDLVDLNRNISDNLSSNSNAQNLFIAYMEARDELDHMKLKLEESFQENDLMSKRLVEQEEELGSVTRERDDVKTELETSMSKARDLELNSSILLEENDGVKSKLEQEMVALSTMSDNLEDALKKRDKYKKLFVKLKVNASLTVDHYINELNLALYDNRQVLMNAVRGGPRDLKEVGRQIDNFLHIQQENNRLTDQVEYLSAQLTVTDILVDEITEQMDHMTQLLQEYKNAGIEPPTLNAQHLQKQVDRYTMLMKNKEQYFAERKAVLREKMSKANKKSDVLHKTTETTNENVAEEPNKTINENNKSFEAPKSTIDENNSSNSPKPIVAGENKIVERPKKKVDDDTRDENTTRPKVVTSHGDTSAMNIGGQLDSKKSPKKKKKKFYKLRKTSKVENFAPSDNNVVEGTQSMPNVNNSNKADKNTPVKAQDTRQYNYF